MKKIDTKAFMLAELVVLLGILAVAITSILQLFIHTNALAEMAGNKTAAVSEAQTKIEQIRTNSFNDIATKFASGGTPGNTFDTTLLPGKGVIYIDATNSELLQVDIIICWRDNYGRVIGEDLDLDGVLDSGEDANSNGKIDSPVELITYYTRR